MCQLRKTFAIRSSYILRLTDGSLVICENAASRGSRSTCCSLVDSVGLLLVGGRVVFPPRLVAQGDPQEEYLLGD